MKLKDVVWGKFFIVTDERAKNYSFTTNSIMQKFDNKAIIMYLTKEGPQLTYISISSDCGWDDLPEWDVEVVNVKVDITVRKTNLNMQSTYKEI